MFQGEHYISFFTGHHDDSTASWHLEDVVAVMGDCHELGQGRIPEDGVVWQTDVRDIKVNELGVVVLAFTKGDREADLPYRCGGTVGHS